MTGSSLMTSHRTGWGSDKRPLEWSRTSRIDGKSNPRPAGKDLEVQEAHVRPAIALILLWLQLVASALPEDMGDARKWSQWRLHVVPYC